MSSQSLCATPRSKAGVSVNVFLLEPCQRNDVQSSNDSIYLTSHVNYCFGKIFDFELFVHNLSGALFPTPYVKFGVK